MNIFLEAVLIFFLGGSIASFLQMYLDTDGKNIFKKDSSCDSCGKKLAWYCMIPVLSWLALLGKSKCCKNKLNIKYLIGEILLGLWFIGIYSYFFSLWEMFLGFALGIIFFLLIIQDFKETQIDSKLLYIFMCISILGAIYKFIFINNFNIYEIIIPILIFSIYWLIYFLGNLIERQLIGEADPYIFTGLGIFFGTQFSLSLFLYSVWLGTFLGILYIFLINKKFDKNIPIPFLPIIFIACLIILLFNYHHIRIQDILILYESFYFS